MNEYIVGIDLGTTNSELAIVRDGNVELVPINGNPIMPSCVGLDNSGRLLVGEPAKNQLIAAPERTVLSIKRRMGEDTKVQLGDRELSPEEISSFILRELKQAGEKYLGQPITKAVITVPAFFNERQRRATQTAGELAGLDVVRIINEPTAAALAYGAGVTEGETMLVYDLGGGTFDVSVVVVESGVVEVKASHGDTRLGGDDFDQLLVERAVLEFKRQYNVDLLSNGQVLRRLKVALERAKRKLSDEPYAVVREEYLDGEHHLEMELDRRDYEEMILPLLEKTLICIHQSLKDAKLSPRDVDKVMLVGGATRTPLVRQLLMERLGLEPHFEINPDLIVAMGAAIQGAIIAGEKHHGVLVDITAHTFSTKVLDRSYGPGTLVCVPIIPRNTPLPASKSEVAFTVCNNQEMAHIEVYQGESIYPAENTFIGDFLIEGLSHVQAGNPILIRFDLDLNGILTVTATEKATGLAKSVRIDTRGRKVLDLENARRNIEEIVRQTESYTVQEDVSGSALDSGTENALKDELNGTSENGPEELLKTAKALRKRAEVLLEQTLSADDAAELKRLLHEIAVAIGESDWETLAEKSDALADLLFYLED